MNYESEAAAIDAFKGKVIEIKKEIAKQIIGQDRIVDEVLMSIYAKGHVLLVGVPGLAKTLLVNTINEVLGLKFNRVQFTPDLMPSDITGTEILGEDKNFKFIPGPIFANLLLADEINRTPPKTQAALLEAMQEKIVTVGGKSYPLPNPFFVLATQNPIEQEGTYPLPEAQVDRFMLKVLLDYPNMEEEQLVLQKQLAGEQEEIQKAIDASQLNGLMDTAKKIYMDERIERYIVQLVNATRQPEHYGLAGLKNLISFGGSPRATIALAKTSKALALIKGREFVIPDDIQDLAHDVLRHRIGLTFEADAEGIGATDIIDQVIEKVQAP